MSQLLAMLGAASGSNTIKTYVDDVFSAYTYKGDNTARTIINGIDLAAKGGLVWIKTRSPNNGTSYENHTLFDSARGFGYDGYLSSNSNNAVALSLGYVAAANNNGFTLDNSAGRNFGGYDFASWTFAKSAKFFDVVKWTGGGESSKTIAHSLGVTPGMIIVKNVTTNGYNWYVWHKDLGQYTLLLNSSGVKETDPSGTNFGGPSLILPTSDNFTVGLNGAQNGATYVAYLFAHDTAADGLIQCGSVTSDANRDVAVTLGWEPQFILFKRANNTGSWQIADSMRKMLAATTGTDQPAASCLQAEASNAESNADAIGIHATGFKEGRLGVAGDTYIYLAIRRPNKPPTSGTQVFAPTTFSTESGIDQSFSSLPAIDMGLLVKAPVVGVHYVATRLIGNTATLTTESTSAEITTLTSVPTPTSQNAFTGSMAFKIEGGNKTYWNATGSGTNCFYGFRRAPDVFDVVCYTGAVGALTINHALGVVPELVIAKVRSNVRDWVVYFGDKSKYLQLNTNVAQQSWANYLNTVTATTITVNGSESLFNESGEKYVAYLFATKAGISKVGSYTGNGSFLSVNCGFSAGSRFVMIKRTDAVGDWFVWDSARGITASIDPRLSLNTTAAEVNTDSSLSPWGNGFEVIQNTATNINVNNATYIYLAIA